MTRVDHTRTGSEAKAPEPDANESGLRGSIGTDRGRPRLAICISGGSLERSRSCEGDIRPAEVLENGLWAEDAHAEDLNAL